MSLIPLAFKILIAATISGAIYLITSYLFKLDETNLLLEKLKLVKD